MMSLLDRIRKFDPRKLRPIDWVVIAAGTIVAFWVVFQVINLFLTLAPIAAGILVMYFIYRWLSSRSEDIPAEAMKSKEQRAVDEAVAHVTAVDAGELPRQSLALEEDLDDGKLSVKQVINPETGFKEPDITRLIEQEQSKLKEADKVTDDVMTQLEERRRRLLEKRGGGE